MDGSQFVFKKEKNMTNSTSFIWDASSHMFVADFYFLLQRFHHFTIIKWLRLFTVVLLKRQSYNVLCSMVHKINDYPYKWHGTARICMRPEYAVSAENCFHILVTPFQNCLSNGLWWWSFIQFSVLSRRIHSQHQKPFIPTCTGAHIPVR